MRSISRSILSLAICAGTTTAVSAQNITLFGKEYTVTRLDYSAGIQLPNIPFPQDPPVPFIESEGIQWAGNNRVLMSADDISDIGFGMPDNWIVEVQLVETGGLLSFGTYRPILMHDTKIVGYDLNPTGVTVNTGADGLGGGGNIVACNGDGILYAYSYQPGSEGTQLEFPSGSGCLANPGECGLRISQMNTNAEDATYVPVRGGEFFITNQDTESVERWNAVTGAFIAAFPVGGAVKGGPAGAVAKGIGYVPDSASLPASLRHADGVVLVCFDNDYPALQAFDTSGNLLGTEILTADGSAGGDRRLDVTDCPDGLQLESLTADPATGRLFLSNQGSSTFCNYLFVLTPVGPECTADFNADDVVNSQDFFDFLTAFFDTDPSADFNGDDAINSQDFFDFLNAFFAGC